MNLTELTERKLLDEAYDLYQKYGQYAVNGWAEKNGIPYSYCEACEDDTPHVGDTCAVCGSFKEVAV